MEGVANYGQTVLMGMSTSYVYVIIYISSNCVYG